MANKRGRAWKMERASVDVKRRKRPRSNKFSAADAGGKPLPGSREQTWVGGYVKSDGTKVRGHYRSL